MWKPEGTHPPPKKKRKKWPHYEYLTIVNLVETLFKINERNILRSTKSKFWIKNIPSNSLPILHYNIDVGKSNKNKANYNKLEYIQIHRKHKRLSKIIIEPKM